MNHAACAYISQDKDWFEEEGLNLTSYESYVTGMALASALARALANSPYILLLDEPMNSLDYRTSKHLRTEFKILQKKLGITIIYVTHNFYEVEEMVERVAVLDKGRVEQIGLPKEIFFHPTEVVNDFIGAPNILTCDYYNRLGFGLVEAKCGDISLVVSSEREKIKKVAILPEDIYLSDTRPLPGGGLT